MTNAKVELKASAWTIFVVMLTLKLSGYIDWSWWIVSLPLWLLPALLGISIIAATLLFLVSSAYDRITS